MKIIHFSDPHSCAPPEEFSAFFDKRLVGFFNYTFRRRFQHDLNLLDKAVEVILEEKPDVAICTGDLTSTGQPAEFAETVKRLEPLIQNHDIPLLFVPGNHDAYVKSRACKEALQATFSRLNNNLWSLDDLPVKTQIGECEFILVNECCPTNIILSCGYMFPESTEKIVAWCAEDKQAPRVLVGHFPILRNYTLIESRRGLNKHEEVRKLVESKKIDLSLCGHMHQDYVDIDDHGKGEICAGSVTRTGNIGIIEYNKTDDTFSYQNRSVSVE